MWLCAAVFFIIINVLAISRCVFQDVCFVLFSLSHSPNLIRIQGVCHLILRPQTIKHAKKAINVGRNVKRLSTSSGTLNRVRCDFFPALSLNLFSLTWWIFISKVLKVLRSLFFFHSCFVFVSLNFALWWIGQSKFFRLMSWHCQNRCLAIS